MGVKLSHTSMDSKILFERNNFVVNKIIEWDPTTLLYLTNNKLNIYFVVQFLGQFS